MNEKINRQCIERIMEKLPDYIADSGLSSKSRDKHFRCFNSSVHNHMDNNYSASLVPNKDNKLWKCFACGASGDIFKAVEYLEGIKHFKDKAKFLSHKYNILLEYDSSSITVKDYYYRAATGELLYKITRKDTLIQGVKKKFFCSYTYSKGHWILGLKGIKRVPYNLPKVLECGKEEHEQVIYFVEGEKCVEALAKLGLCATTTAGGAGGWEKYSTDYIPYFNSLKVVVIPDNDAPGKSFSGKVLKDISKVAKTVRYLELPGLKEKEDVADWIHKGGTAEELQRLTEALQDEVFQEDKKSSDEVKQPSNSEYEGLPIINENPIFIVNGCYCKKVKEGAVSLTNFVIKPYYEIQGTGSEPAVIKAELVTNSGYSAVRHMSAAAFDNVDMFRQTINGTHFKYTGRIEDLQHIKLLVNEDIEATRKGVSYEGLHKLEDKWYVVSGEDTCDEDLNPSEALMLLEGSSELSSSILKSSLINAEELSKLAPHLFSFNRLPICSTILGYVCGLYLKAKLEECGVKYNHLLIEGHSGSGKSSTLENVITPLLCMDKHSMLDASQSTQFALQRGLSSSNLMPLIIDEYKPRQIGIYKVNIISNILRNSYDSHKAVKGVSILGKNREFIARASVILCGESGVDETANIERSLRAIFSSLHFSEEAESSMNILKAKRGLMNKLGKSLLKGALNMKEEDIRILHENISKSHVAKSFSNHRVRNSITNCILGIYLLKKVFEDLKLVFEEVCGVKVDNMAEAINVAAGEDLLDSSTSSRTVIEDTLETLNRMAANGILREGTDYALSRDTEVDGEITLRLNYVLFYDRFLKYCKEYNVSHDILSLNSFKKQLKKMDYCLSYNRPVSFKNYSYSPGESKTYRAAVLSISKLAAKDLEIDFLMNKNREATEKKLVDELAEMFKANGFDPKKYISMNLIQSEGRR